MSHNYCKKFCLVLYMVLNSCSSYIGDSKKVSKHLKTKSIIEQNKKTEIDKIKIRKRVVHYFSKKLEKNPKYGSPLPKGYRKFLINQLPSTLQVGQYLFFGFSTPNPGDEQKVARSLLCKQNSDQSCYPLDCSKLVQGRKKVKYSSGITEPFCKKKLFFIAATTDFSSGYYIDLSGQENRNKMGSPVYKCYEDGTIKMCAKNMNRFLRSCKMKTSLKGAHSDSVDHKMGLFILM